MNYLINTGQVRIMSSSRNNASSAYRKSTNLRTYKIFYICGPSACVAICGFEICRPNFSGDLRICVLRTQFFAELKLPQIWNFFIFLLTNIDLKFYNSHFFKIKNSFKQTFGRLLDIFAIKGDFILSVLWWKICRFAICGLAHLRNLWICGVLINQKKFAELKFADLHTSEICKFAIADWASELADLWFADLKNIYSPTFGIHG
jgi:hypothetical protein